MSNFIFTLVAQFPVMLDIQHNLDTILSILSQAEPNTLVILPEGALSGYAEDIEFLHKINQQLLELSLRKLQEVVVQSEIHPFNLWVLFIGKLEVVQCWDILRFTTRAICLA